MIIIEKILERLEEERELAEKEMEKCIFKGLPYHDSTAGEVIGIKKAIEIVQEVAKEYDWIPCSERLPEKYRICWITWKVDGYSEEVYRATCYKWGWFCIDTQEEFEPHEVVAWKYYEKPAPYQKGDK